MLVKEKKKEDDDIGLLHPFVSQLPHALRYACLLVFCHLLGSVILSACLVLGFVASWAILLLL